MLVLLAVASWWCSIVQAFILDYQSQAVVTSIEYIFSECDTWAAVKCGWKAYFQSFMGRHVMALITVKSFTCTLLELLFSFLHVALISFVLCELFFAEFCFKGVCKVTSAKHQHRSLNCNLWLFWPHAVTSKKFATRKKLLIYSEYTSAPEKSP